MKFQNITAEQQTEIDTFFKDVKKIVNDAIKEITKETDEKLKIRNTCFVMSTIAQNRKVLYSNPIMKSLNEKEIKSISSLFDKHMDSLRKVCGSDIMKNDEFTGDPKMDYALLTGVAKRVSQEEYDANMKIIIDKKRATLTPRCRNVEQSIDLEF